MPADAGAEAWCDDIIVKVSGSTNRYIFRFFRRNVQVPMRLLDLDYLGFLRGHSPVSSTSSQFIEFQ